MIFADVCWEKVKRRSASFMVTKNRGENRPTAVVESPCAECRRTPRYPVSTWALIDLVNGLPLCHGVNVHIRDFSTTGVGLISPIELTPGHDFVLYLERDVCGMLYHVIRCVPVGDKFFVGAEYMCSLPADGEPETSAESDEAAIEQIRRVILR
jgi:hypothetical protein